MHIKNYLENGGNILVSGSEIGWDLGREHTVSEAGDMAFYNNYLKASYVYDGNYDMTTAYGLEGSLFDDVELNFGQTYPEDYPDDIDPINGSNVFIRYNQTRSGSTFRKAGVYFIGTFGESSKVGKMVYLSFPFETNLSLDQRIKFMESLMVFFDELTPIKEQLVQPLDYSISQNYPNPFNGETHFTVTLPQNNKIQIYIYDINGREIAKLAKGSFVAGEHIFGWNATDFASGQYFIQLKVGSFYKTQKILLLK